ncbi:MAG: CtsR family transcriptional regulator [Peptococcaceae bacterium]|nr:CtsR family transcriptional regulator [Peptococcaceae bacterium]
MGSLSHGIELYLKKMLAQADGGVLIVQRSVLSEKFCCVPSQINYVLQTRFTPANGYVVETRRGGGGYVRIQAIPLNDAHDFRPLMEASGKSLTEKQAEGILTYLVEEKVLPPDVGTLLSAIMKERVLQPLRSLSTNEMRARLMVQLLAHMSIGSQDEKQTTVSADEETDDDNNIKE